VSRKQETKASLNKRTTTANKNGNRLTVDEKGTSLDSQPCWTKTIDIRDS